MRSAVNALHVVEAVEKRVDEPCSHGKESWKLGLEQVVVVLVFVGRNLKVLLNLEQVLLVTQRLFLLLAELVERIVVAVKVNELAKSASVIWMHSTDLVIALDSRLADLFADLLQLLARLHNT
jgi:hypothetical protein